MKKLLFMALVMITFQLFVHQPSAEMYKWVDKNGVIHFSDTPPKSAQNVETYETSNSPQPNSNAASAKSKAGKAYSKSKGKIKHAGKVKIYTTSWCRYCKDAVKFLRANGIPFQQYDVEKDPKAASKMRALGGTGGVPFAIINGEIVLGFSKRGYKKALGMN